MDQGRPQQIALQQRLGLTNVVVGRCLDHLLVNLLVNFVMLLATMMYIIEYGSEGVKWIEFAA